MASTYGNRALVDLTGSVADIEKTFQVHIGIYQHPTEDRKFYAPDAEPSVDAGIPIDSIAGLNNYYLPKPRFHKKPPGPKSYDFNGSGTNGDYIGQDFRNAYIPGSSLNGSGRVSGII